MPELAKPEAVVRGDAIGEAQFEIIHDQVLVPRFGDEEVVALGRLFLRGFAGDRAVRTDQYSGRPAQPVRSWPLNNLLEARVRARRLWGRSGDESSTISLASAGTSTLVEPMSVIAVVMVRSSFTWLPPNSREPLSASAN